MTSIDHHEDANLQIGGDPVSSSNPVPVSLAAGSAVVGHVITDSGSTTAVTGTVLTAPGATANSGGVTSTARMASAAASTNATNVKTTPGRIYCIEGKNNAAYDVFLVLYDSATNPPVPATTTIRKKMVCPAGQAFIRDYPVGLSFANGIGYAFTKLVADNDTTALVAADITAMNMDYV